MKQTEPRPRIPSTQALLTSAFVMDRIIEVGQQGEGNVVIESLSRYVPGNDVAPVPGPCFASGKGQHRP